MLRMSITYLRRYSLQNLRSLPLAKIAVNSFISPAYFYGPGYRSLGHDNAVRACRSQSSDGAPNLLQYKNSKLKREERRGEKRECAISAVFILARLRLYTRIRDSI
jgi:hypothetical protein